MDTPVAWAQGAGVRLLVCQQKPLGHRCAAYVARGKATVTYITTVASAAAALPDSLPLLARRLAGSKRMHQWKGLGKKVTGFSMAIASPQ